MSDLSDSATGPVQSWVDGMDTQALADALHLAQHAPATARGFRFWASPERMGTDSTREVLEVRFSGERVINHIAFQTARFPHRVEMEWLDESTDDWVSFVQVVDRPDRQPTREVETQPVQLVILDSVPKVVDTALVVNKVEHPQHYGENHWWPQTFHVMPITCRSVRLVLTRIPNDGVPVDPRGIAAPYSLALKNVQVGFRVLDHSDVPRYVEEPNPDLEDGTFATSTDILGSRVVYSLVERNAERAIDGDRDTSWRSEPQPVSYAVVNFYADTRTRNGEAQVLDRFYIDPRTVGVHCNVYYSNDDPSGEFEALDSPIPFPALTINGEDPQSTMFLQRPWPENVVFSSKGVSYADIDNDFLQFDATDYWWIGMALTAITPYGDNSEHPWLSFGNNFLRQNHSTIEFIAATGEIVTLPLTARHVLGAQFSIVVVHNPADHASEDGYPPGISLVYKLGDDDSITITRPLNSPLPPITDKMRIGGYHQDGEDDVPPPPGDDGGTGGRPGPALTLPGGHGLMTIRDRPLMLTPARILRITRNLRKFFGVNSHFQYSGTTYQDGTQPAQIALDVINGLINGTVYRERCGDGGGIQGQAMTLLRPNKVYGQANCDVNSTETTIRGGIHRLAISSHKNDVAALTGSNEPNNRTVGSGPTWKGTGTWYRQCLKQQFWIWDQVQIEVAAGNWGATPGVSGGRPLVVGPGVKHEHVPLDTDIADLAADTWDPGDGGGAKHIDAWCDEGDFHFYPSAPSSGQRLTLAQIKTETNNRVPPGLIFGEDGKCSREMFELQRFRQIYRDVNFPMNHSEWGYPHTTSQWLKDAKVFGPDTLLRDFNLGVHWAIVYQALSDPKTDPDLGIYDQTIAYPNGAYPIYVALKKLVNYPDTQEFDDGAGGDIGWLDKTAGKDPDAGVNVFSSGGGVWDIYITREAQNSLTLTLVPGYTVTGMSPTGQDGSGNNQYLVPLNDVLTILTVNAPVGGGTPPHFTAADPQDAPVNAAYTYTFTASGDTPLSYTLEAGSGAFPPGLTLNKNSGVFSGTPTATGTYKFKVRVTNAAGFEVSSLITMLVTSVPVLTAEDPPDALLDASYRYVFKATGYPAPTFVLLSGTLPDGLVLTPDGTLSGTPSVTGSFQFKVRAKNIAGNDTTALITMAVTDQDIAPVFVDETPPLTGKVGVLYDYQFTAIGSPDPTFSLASDFQIHEWVVV